MSEGSWFMLRFSPVFFLLYIVDVQTDVLLYK